tara:strand:- start:144 stop:440 length:297 start_codon:yes stop_codon:yes gene_type:complete
MTISLALGLTALVLFAIGLITGGMSSHQAGEELQDQFAFLLCRVASPLLVLGAWGVGFAALLQRHQGSFWKPVTVLIPILIFLVLLFYSAWRGTAAFH